MLPRRSFSSYSNGARLTSNLCHPRRGQAWPGLAWKDIFDYIEMFYNAKRRHSSSQDLSPGRV
jgi:hypothetical protein